MTEAAILVAVVCLSYANGANDNFKGVATLFGSGTTNYRGALAWATGATFLGSLMAVFLAGELLASFSGKGLVDSTLATSPGYGAAVALGAGLTVLLASRIGMPVSTTHSLVGALIGAGLAADSTVDLARLGGSFFIPLAISPVLAIAATAAVYPVLRFARLRLGVDSETCLCIGSEVVEVIPAAHQTVVLERAEHLSASVGDTVSCKGRYRGRLLGVGAETVLDGLHYASAGVVSLARGLNDTPKIAALLLLAPALTGFSAIALVGAIIAIGGLVSARRVAETMSRRVTAMNHGQGFTANLITGVTVIGASMLGMPVSTTHVSCGALFGIGAVTRQAHWKMMGVILGAWVATLPLAIALGATSFWIVSSL